VRRIISAYRELNWNGIAPSIIEYNYNKDVDVLSIKMERICPLYDLINLKCQIILILQYDGYV
jgi:hypothetical protein